jgi:DNA polymerase-3 subunit gamma/tau
MKVYIIDEAHQLSNPAFNALLKMLEEPPPHVVFVLATTEPHRLPATVVSRCQRFEFRRLGNQVLGEHIAHVASAEKIDIDELASVLIVRHARGSARDALTLLDQAAGTAEGKVTREVILEILGEAPEDLLLDLAEAIANEDILAVFSRVEEMVTQGWDPRQLLVQLLEEFRALFLAHRGVEDNEVDPAHAERRRQLAQVFTGAHLEWVLQALAEAQADMRLSTHPRLTLEVALARAANLEVRETQTVVARLERLERLLIHGERSEPAKPRPTPTARPPETETTAPPAPPPVTVEAAPEPRAEAPAAPAPAADASLNEQWTAVLEAVRRRSRVTHTHLREAWPIELDEERLVIGFEKEFHAGELTKRPDHLTRVNTAIAEVLGRKVQLVTEVRPAERPNDDRAAEEIEEQSPVDLVKKGLGAEVVEEVQS